MLTSKQDPTNGAQLWEQITMFENGISAIFDKEYTDWKVKGTKEYRSIDTPHAYAG